MAGFADELFEMGKRLGDASAASYRAGDEHGESARKLRRLIVRCEKVHETLCDGHAGDATMLLQVALDEARR